MFKKDDILRKTSLQSISSAKLGQITS